MTARTHVLKTWPEPFQAVWDGLKTHELRVNDRAYAVGDGLVLREWDPAEIERRHGNGIFYAPVDCAFTGRDILARVTYVTPGGSFGLPTTHVVMSIVVTGKQDRGER
jgi:hypothetical protein